MVTAESLLSYGKIGPKASKQEGRNKGRQKQRKAGRDDG
jgi:hypothetical protein